MFWTLLFAVFGGVLLALLVAPLLRKGWGKFEEGRWCRAVATLRPLHVKNLQEAAMGNPSGIVVATVTQRALEDCREKLQALPPTPKVQRALAEIEGTPEERRLMDTCVLLVEEYGRGLTSRGEQ